MSKSTSISNGEQDHLEAFRDAPGMKRNIKSRHAQMMAIGGAIGTSFFLATGQALAVGGPAFLFLAYVLTSSLVYGMVTLICEIASFLPVPGGSMSYFATRFVSPSLGFALGWLYFYSFGIIVAYELTAAGIIINYWPNNVPIAVWITVVMIVVMGLNLSPVGAYAEAEFWFAGLKVALIIGLIIMGIVLMAGGGPDHEVLGFKYWNNPGAVKEYLAPGAGGRFTAFLWVWVYSVFSFNFSAEILMFAAGEIRNPRKNLPSASRRYFIRMVVFYFIGTLIIGAICKSTAKGLVSGDGNANASPFVVAIQNAGIKVLPSIINAGILCSAWSAGNAYLYMASRTLYSLAMAGNAPKIFTKCNRYGLPIYAVLASSLFCPLAYLNCNTQAGVVFNWFINMTNNAGYTSWVICCIVYWRFRKAVKVQGVELPHRSILQPYASYVCFVLFIFLNLCNGFTVFYPGRWSISDFMTAYIGIVLFFVFFVGHKIFAGRKDKWARSAESIDLVTGLAEVEADEHKWREEEAAAKALRPTTWYGVILKKVSALWE